MLSGSTITLSPMLLLPRLNTRNTIYTVSRLSLLWLELCCIFVTSQLRDHQKTRADDSAGIVPTLRYRYLLMKNGVLQDPVVVLTSMK